MCVQTRRRKCVLACIECAPTKRFLFILQQVVKTGGTPKVPDCFQRTPKKLCIPEKAEILAVNVDSKGK